LSLFEFQIGRERTPSVVPANAGTHTPRPLS
jgi:hypothetical protein